MVFDPSRAGKSLCGCGMVAETFGGLCDRCASLQTLGLGTQATLEQIESTYLTLVKVWHPDRFTHDPRLSKEAEEKLKEINAAHDYLLAHPPQETSRSVPRTERPAAPRSPGPPMDFEEEETEEVRRILRRRQKSQVPAILVKVGFALGAVAVVVLLWFTGDSFLSSNALTARAWEQLKLEVKHDAAVHFTSATTTEAQQTNGTPAQMPDAHSVTPDSTATANAPVAHNQPIQHVQGVKPYITAGLTPSEVLAVLGKPTSSSGEKMFYSHSEIDFKNGQVAGWKIDPSSPIRVKLWSESPSVPGLTTFGVGSSKSDVIALQGTPSFFSDNEFGYGNSRVFFQNNRVVSWKETAGSAPLRVAH